MRHLPLGWSHVLFPAETYRPWPPGGALAHSLLLALLAGLLFFSRLDSALLEPEEARYAEIPRQMLAEGAFLTPVLHGEPYYHKPPLLYWLVMACYSAWGVEDRVARLVPGTAGVLTVLLTYWWGRRPLGTGAAFLGALILCLSARFVYLARMLSTDCLLSWWVTAALLAGYQAIAGQRRCRRWWVISAGACGLGVLSKGPVALALAVPPLLVWQILYCRVCKPSVRAWLLYLAVALAPPAPWFTAVALRDSQAALDFFWLHNVVRYAAPFDHAKPWWFYLPPLLAGIFPWTLLLVPLGRYLLSGLPDHGVSRPRALGFFLLAFLWVLGFYSMAGCKRAVYLLPALPLLALALGCYLAAALPWRVAGRPGAWLPVPVRRPAAWVGCTFALFAGLLTAVHFLLPEYNRRFALREQVQQLQDWADTSGGPVFCYPRPWDSVSFYLRCQVYRAYRQEQRSELAGELARHPEGLVFFREERFLQELLAALPPQLELIPCAQRHGQVVAGLVRPRSGTAP